MGPYVGYNSGVEPFLIKLCHELLTQHKQCPRLLAMPSSVRLGLLTLALQEHDIPLHGYHRKLITNGVDPHYLFAAGLDDEHVIDAVGRSGWESICAGYFRGLPEEQQAMGWTPSSFIFLSNDLTKKAIEDLDEENRVVFDRVLQEQKVLVGARLIARDTQPAPVHTREAKVLRL